MEYRVARAVTKLGLKLDARKISSDTIVARQEDGEQSARAKYRNIYTWATLDHEWQNGAATRVIASYTLLSAIGRLDVKTLALNTPDYLPEVHYHQVRDAWHGLRTPSGQ